MLMRIDSHSVKYKCSSASPLTQLKSNFTLTITTRSCACVSETSFQLKPFGCSLFRVNFPSRRALELLLVAFEPAKTACITPGKQFSSHNKWTAEFRPGGPIKHRNQLLNPFPADGDFQSLTHRSPVHQLQNCASCTIIMLQRLPLGE